MKSLAQSIPPSCRNSNYISTYTIPRAGVRGNYTCPYLIDKCAYYFFSLYCIMKVIQPTYCTVHCESRYIVKEVKKDKTKQVFERNPKLKKKKKHRPKITHKSHKKKKSTAYKV